MSGRPAMSDRRRFLAMAGGGTLAAAIGGQLVAPSPVLADTRIPGDPFRLGVASGEPLADGVVLWTRLAPDPTAADGTGGMPPVNVQVSWQVAEDERFRRVVRAGTTWATPQLAHSVHVDVRGLRPDRVYWYRFRAGREASAVGRTRTAPSPDARLASLAFAFASCQNLPEGHFTVLRHLAEDDLDFVVHLGDYIYEGSGQGTIGRGHLPAAETFSLTDYRIRHGQYKLDPDLQAAHAAFPWLVTIDDHDVENNWAASHSQPDSEPDQDPAVFLQRRAAAFQAFYENQPLRLASRPDGPDMLLYRRLTFGRLAGLHMVDTRQYRDVQLTNQDERFDPARTMLGADQEAWLLNGLDRSRSTWNILGNQVFMMQADHTDGEGVRYGMDTWDGYAAARQRLFDGVRDQGIDNLVIVTGDAHRSAAADLKLNFADQSSPTVGVEFLGTSISSGQNGSPMDSLGQIWLRENPHMKFHNSQRGYGRCEVTPTTWRTDYKVVPYVTEPNAAIQTAASIYLEAGVPGVRQVDQSAG
jgi:alkaline phosphatase D